MTDSENWELGDQDVQHTWSIYNRAVGEKYPKQQHKIPQKLKLKFIQSAQEWTLEG